MDRICLIPEIAPRYRSTYFSHVFEGEYSAGYYSYSWAAVLDADAFSYFKKNGLFDPKTAKAFITNILERGGTEDPVTLYKRFTGGNEPSIQPLLDGLGLKKCFDTALITPGSFTSHLGTSGRYSSPVGYN